MKKLEVRILTGEGANYITLDDLLKEWKQEATWWGWKQHQFWMAWFRVQLKLEMAWAWIINAPVWDFRTDDDKWRDEPALIGMRKRDPRCLEEVPDGDGDVECCGKPVPRWAMPGWVGCGSHGDYTSYN